jgi:serine/threonine-protein kinase
VEASEVAATTTMGAIGPTQAVMMTDSTRAVPAGGGAGGAGGGGAGGGGDASRAHEERQRRIRRVVALLVALLVVLAVIAVFLVKALDTTQHVNVPSVAGQTVQEATQTLQSESLSVGATSRETSNGTQKGEVISTDPKAGAKVAKNSKVDLVVSAGPTVTDVTVPSVVGQQFTAAGEALTNAGLSFKPKYVTSTKAPGTVLAQNPAANASVPSTTVVKLTVSNSQSTVGVPNVVGDTQTSAGSAITGDNLTVGNQTSACSQNVATGNIASQSPAAGTQVQTSTPVNLVVSNGPCSATVPDVIQETQSAASSAITNTPGLTPVFTPVDCSQSGGTVGTVQSESPAAGTVLSPPFPQTVTMTVCEQPTTSTTTSTTSGGTTTTSNSKT